MANEAWTLRFAMMGALTLGACDSATEEADPTSSVATTSTSGGGGSGGDATTASTAAAGQASSTSSVASSTVATTSSGGVGGSGGSSGSNGVVVNRQNLAWSDRIQTTESNHGWNGLGVEGSGALTRVDNPVGEGHAIEHRLDFPDFGRAQLGLWAEQDTLQHPSGVWIAQKIYFPAVIHTTSGWLSITDHHAVDGSGNRWHTQPGFMLYNGPNVGDRMKLWDAWHGSGLGDVANNLSDVALPVGEVFWLEYHYVWTTEPRAIPVYLNGRQIWETTAQPTRSGAHQQAEHYTKWYGAGDWTPSPALRYTLEVLMSNVGQIVTPAQ